MNEIKEIMNGNVKVFNVRIEGETIAFDTPYNSNWNFMARDFEQIIDTLQQENARLKDKNKKALDLLQILHYNFPDYDEMHKKIEDIEEILKEN